MTIEISKSGVIKMEPLEDLKNREKSATPKCESLPSPKILLEALQKKAKFLKMLDGYVEEKDLLSIAKQTTAAIKDLEEIISATERTD